MIRSDLDHLIFPSDGKSCCITLPHNEWGTPGPSFCINDPKLKQKNPYSVLGGTRMFDKKEERRVCFITVIYTSQPWLQLTLDFYASGTCG